MLTFHFGTNLKMHQTPAQTRQYVRAVRAELAGVEGSEQCQVWIIPPFTSLEAAAEEVSGTSLLVGAQNIHWSDEGAYTGEISASMVKACGARFVMLGHAERRTLFGETDELINRKVRAALRHGLGVMLCVGEPRAVYEAGAGHAHVTCQLQMALHGVSHPGELWVLYEPVWSIGEGGIPAEPRYVSSAFDNIRQTLIQRFGREGECVPLLYGGSVDESNCAEYATLPAAAGMGVGRAGLRPQRFVSIFRSAYRAWQTVTRTEGGAC